MIGSESFEDAIEQREDEFIDVDAEGERDKRNEKVDKDAHGREDDRNQKENDRQQQI